MDEWKDDIEKYLSGKLSPAERHALEKKALNDPFLAEALEGAEMTSADIFVADVDDLNEKILGQGKNRWLWPLRIAASVIGIAVISTIVIYSTGDTTENLASNKEENKEQTPAAPKSDSVNQAGVQSGDADTNEAKPTEAEEKKSENLIAAIKEAKPKRKELEASKPDALLAEENEVTATPLSAGAGGTQSSQPVVTQPLSSGPGIVTPTDSISLNGLASTTAPTSTVPTSASDDLIIDAIKTGSTTESKTSKDDARLSRVKSIAIPKILVSGVVRDQQGQPIPGVNIVTKGSATGTTTNAEGKYSLEVLDKDQALEYSFVGYASVEQLIDKSKADALDVSLSEDVTQLSEVVVTGYGQKRDGGEPVVRLAEPIGGRKAYDTYLEEKKIYPQLAIENKSEGRVIIEFTVGLTGALSDFEVIKKLGFGCEEEVIRLVKEGPQWRPTYIDNEAVESLVRIKTRFTLPGK